MIIYGHYYTRFKKHALHETVCPKCGGKDTMYLSAGCRTYHAMFVPIAPGAKQITQRCGVCRGEWYPFPDKAEVARRMEAETRRPWYLYFWLWIVALVAVAVAIAAIFGK